MRRDILIAVVIALVIFLTCMVFLERMRYQRALEWIEEEGIFSKATSYLDEFPFITELFDPGFVDYANAGEEMEYGNYAEAIALLEPLAEQNYRNSARMLEYCLDRILNPDSYVPYEP